MEIAKLVAHAVLEGTPVMLWTNYSEVQHLDGYTVDNNFDLKVVTLRTNPDSGIVVVVPKNVEAWDIYRKGKLKMISRTARRPLTWAGRYFKASRTVKSGLDPQVIREVAKLRFPEIKELPTKSIREKAIKLIAEKLVLSRHKSKPKTQVIDDEEMDTSIV